MFYGREICRLSRSISSAAAFTSGWANRAETTATPDPDSLLEREVIGRAVTNREANVRVKPASSGKLVRQLSKGVELMILAKYEDDAGAIWYEVTTTTGKTYGFVRDYVVNVLKLDKNAETLTYPDEG